MAGKEADAKRHQTTKPHLPASKLLCLANPMLKPQCGMTFSKKKGKSAGAIIVTKWV